MTHVNEPVIVSEAPCSCCSVATVQVHHRDYPEAMAEGMTPVSAAEHLVHQLASSLEFAQDTDRREAIEKAIAEVREFLVHYQPS